MRFVEFKKIPRLSRDIIVTEKLDGSNGQICVFSLESIKKEFAVIEQMYEWIEQYCLYIHPENPHVEESDKLYLFAASRNRWLTTGKQNDNHAFAYWAKEHGVELVMLGEGRHFGEWYGKGIQRGYGLEEKRWALFNVSKWQNKNLPLVDEKQAYPPSCCEVVPILYEGMFETEIIELILEGLKRSGSCASRGFMQPEGIIIYHKQGNVYFKKTIENDEKGKTNE